MSDEKPMSAKAVYDVYFEHGEVRPDFNKEYISLWPEWLGEERLHLLDEVSENEWLRFNQLLLAASEAFRMGVVNHRLEIVEFPPSIEPLLSDYQKSMGKESSQFSQFVIPSLECVITEEWDYTYILWHRNAGTVEAMEALLLQSKLHHFSD